MGLTLGCLWLMGSSDNSKNHLRRLLSVASPCKDYVVGRSRKNGNLFEYILCVVSLFKALNHLQVLLQLDQVYNSLHFCSAFIQYLTFLLKLIYKVTQRIPPSVWDHFCTKMWCDLFLCCMVPAALWDRSGCAVGNALPNKLWTVGLSTVILSESCRLLPGAGLARFSSDIRASWKLVVNKTNVKSFQNTAEMRTLFSSRLPGIMSKPFSIWKKSSENKSFWYLRKVSAYFEKLCLPSLAGLLMWLMIVHGFNSSFYFQSWE